MKKIIFAAACVFILISAWECLAKSNSFKSLATGLQDGVYIIERINYMQFPAFPNEREAKAWLVEFKKNPKILKPKHDYFQLHLSGNDFIIHQLKQTDSGGYEPNGNFFVSVSARSSWAFEESANRVTIVTNGSMVENAGPVAGLLETGDVFTKELREMGLGIIDLSSVDQVGNENIIGRDAQGNLLKGKIQNDGQGQITNILCGVKGNSKNYTLNINVSYDEIKKAFLHVRVSIRHEDDQPWQNTLEYGVKNYSPLTKSLEMDRYWRQFANSNTLIVYYDAKNKTTKIREPTGVIRPLGKNEAIENFKNESHVRWVVLFFLGISTVIGLAFLVKTVNRDGK